ncbi:MAG TPA: cupin domain-containing protein [Candidatus Binataceae bacterium]|nr:cupin domain-containing protein [Candidatus Binataceae bacterium]
MPPTKQRRAPTSRGRPQRRESPSHSSVTAGPPVLQRFRRNFRWDSVELEPYKLRTPRGAEFAGASRQVLAGRNGEPLAFELRYFELEPGGFTSLERHRHCHVVIGVRGRGRVRVDTKEHRIAPFDTIYIGPNQPHRLKTQGREPFGFFCIVDKRRDKPRPILD